MTKYLHEIIQQMIAYINLKEQLYKQKQNIAALDIWANFNGFKCPNYEYISESIESALIFLKIAHLIFWLINELLVIK